MNYLTTFVSLKLYSPDVRSFLLMDRMQNLSDASEDEDDKVSHRSKSCEGGIVHSKGVVMSFISVFVKSSLCCRAVDSVSQCVVCTW